MGDSIAVRRGAERAASPVGSHLCLARLLNVDYAIQEG